MLQCLVNWSDFEGNPKAILALFGTPVIARGVDGVIQIMERRFYYIVNSKNELVEALIKVGAKRLYKEIGSALEAVSLNLPSTRI